MRPLMRKLFRDLGREKTFVLVVALQLLLILSMTILLSYTTLFFNPERALQRPLRIGYLADSPLIDQLGMTYRTQLIHFASLDDALAAYNASRIDTVLASEQGPGNTTDLTIYVPNDTVRQAIVLSVLKDPLDRYDAELMDAAYGNRYTVPIAGLSMRGMTTKGENVLYEILLGFLVPFILLVPIFIVGTLLIDIVSEDQETRRLPLLLTAMSLRSYWSETFATGMVFIALQELLWLGLLALRGIPLHQVALLLAFLALLSAFVLLSALVLAFLFGS